MWRAAQGVEGETVRVQVDDAGVGMDPARVRQGRGTANLQSRAVVVGGRIGWHGRPGGGTRVVLETPLSGPA